jgi:DNA-directed RNA polymerase specialized sigma24 family protein
MAVDSPSKDTPVSSIKAALEDDEPTLLRVTTPVPEKPGRPEEAERGPGKDVPCISRDHLRVFLGHPSTQDRIRRVVLSRLTRRTPKDAVNDMLQEANIATMTSKWGPRALQTGKGWLGMVTIRAMVSYLRMGARNRKWLIREVEVEPLRPEWQERELPSDRWLVSKWLARTVEGSERDQETLEILAHGVRSAKGAEELAAEHGMTVASLKSRVFLLQEKYEPWRRRRRTTIAMMAIGAVLAAAIGALLALPSAHPAAAAVTPAPTPAASSAAPVSSAEATAAPVDLDLVPVSSTPSASAEPASSAPKVAPDSKHRRGPRKRL